MGSEQGDAVVRAGAAMAFQRPGMSDFTGVFGANQGIQATLLRDVQQLDAADSAARQPGAAGVAGGLAADRARRPITNTVNAFDSNIQMPYTQSWSAGWQRKLTRDSALEVRYVGSRHQMDWDTVNLNEPNITTNGFLNEFRAAQANLQANIAAGRGNTFAYTGAGTTPLPIFLANFNGQAAANAGNAAAYTGANWTSAAFLGFLAARNPNPHGFMCNNAAGCTTATLANGLIGNATFRNNAAAAGLPVELLRRQSRHDRRGQPDDQRRRRHARALDAVRIPQAVFGRSRRSTPATRGARRRSCSGTGSTSRRSGSIKPARSATCSMPSRATSTARSRSAATAGSARI